MSSAEPVDVELAPSAVPIKLVGSLGGGVGMGRSATPAERSDALAVARPPTSVVDGSACEASEYVVAAASVDRASRKTWVPARVFPITDRTAIDLDRTVTFGFAATGREAVGEALAADGAPAAGPLELGAELGAVAGGCAVLGAAFATAAPAS
jgi:hypothetical protein